MITSVDRLRSSVGLRSSSAPQRDRREVVGPDILQRALESPSDRRSDGIDDDGFGMRLLRPLGGLRPASIHRTRPVPAHFGPFSRVGRAEVGEGGVIPSVEKWTTVVHYFPGRRHLTRAQPRRPRRPPPTPADPVRRPPPARPATARRPSPAPGRPGARGAEERKERWTFCEVVDDCRPLLFRKTSTTLLLAPPPGTDASPGPPALQAEPADTHLVEADVMGQLVADVPRDLLAQGVRVVAEVPAQRVAEDHDPVGMVVAEIPSPW